MTTDKTLRFLTQTIDHHRTTDFFVEPAGQLQGPRAGSRVRHLVARYSDGRPEFATGIPDHWTDDEIVRFAIEGKPASSAPSAPSTKH